MTICGAGYVWADKTYRAPGPLQIDAVVMIPPGSGAAKIANILSTERILEHPWIFRLAARLSGKGKALRAGEFMFPAGISIEGIFDLLITGKTVLHSITVVEGQTVRDVISTLMASPFLEGDITALPSEGSLLPETYHFARGTSRHEALEVMRRDMQTTLDQLWVNRAPDLPFQTQEEALTLASIVEKETGLAAERTLVAGVFVNRLKKRMKLQSDPTVIYALTEGESDLGRKLTRKDLQIESPYNTYFTYGLPPSPIANPGRAALEAVLNPADTKALYFVADGSGGHAFANSLEEHNDNVNKWRRFLRSQK